MDWLNLVGILFASIAGLSLIGCVVAIVLDLIEKIRTKHKYNKEHHEEFKAKRAAFKDKLKTVLGIIFGIILAIWLLYVIFNDAKGVRHNTFDEDYDVIEESLNKYQHRY